MGRICIQQWFSILRLCINTTTVAAFQLPGTAARGRLVYELFEKPISSKLREHISDVVDIPLLFLRGFYVADARYLAFDILQGVIETAKLEI
jgi:hypothetical protein